MTSIFFWAADRQGCGHYRCHEPARVLRDLGHDATASIGMPESVLDEADVIVGQRVSKPGPSTVWKRLARKGRAKLVYEVDDDLLSIEPSNVEGYRFFGRPEIQDAIRTNAGLADEVTVTTEPLADVMSAFNPNVRVIPNYVASSLLDLRPRQAETPTLGWYGSGSHRGAFTEVGPQILRYLNRNPEVRWHTIGSRFAWQRDLPTSRSRFDSWIEDIDVFLKKVDFWVGLAPMEDTVFNRSRSDLRIKQMCALGVPTVASSVGSYKDAAASGAPIRLLRAAHDWPRAIHALMQDEALRDELSASGRAWASAQTIEGNAKAWEAILP